MSSLLSQQNCPYCVRPVNPSLKEMGADQARVQGHSQLQSEFEASLGYISLCLKTKERERESENKEEVRGQDEEEKTYVGPDTTTLS